METCMLGYERAKTVTEIAAWANELIGKAVPNHPEYQIVKVVQFQLVPTQSGYDAINKLWGLIQQGITSVAKK